MMDAAYGARSMRGPAWARKPATWASAAVLLLAVIGVSRLVGSHENAGDARAQPRGNEAAAIPASVTTVEQGMTSQYLEATGTVTAELDSALASKVMGRVVSVAVREGEVVRRGQPLIRLDSGDLDASVAQAAANLRAANVGYDNSQTVARMESSLSTARVAEAQARVSESEAALQAANARLDLAQAGPRKQERAQAVLTVAQARAGLSLSESNLNRMAALVKDGAISAQQYDSTRTQYDVAKAQYEAAQQAQSMADEGTRTEEVTAARGAVRQAQAGLSQARAALAAAQAGALQVNVRREEIRAAQAQVGQSRAAVRLAEVTRSYTAISAPFDGVVTRRMADPGTMAAPGAPLLRIQGGALRLDAVVPESALYAARKGGKVEVQIAGLSDRPTTGTVTEILPQGDPASHTFLVRIALAAGTGARAGMFGRARFRTGADRRIAVPPSALVQREGLTYVYTVDPDNTAQLRLVTIGATESGRTEVQSGLNAGERIVVGGLDRLSDGVRVAPEGR